MVTGRYDESRSPEALNARPFLRGRGKPAPAIRPATVAPSFESIDGTTSPGARSASALAVPPPDRPPAPSPAEVVPAGETDEVDAARAGGGDTVAVDANGGRRDVAGEAGEPDGEEVGR
jgi:hypothetical protein